MHALATAFVHSSHCRVCPVCGTGKEILETPAATIKKWPVGERTAETAKLVAARLEGVPETFIEKCLDFRAAAPTRFFNMKPYVCAVGSHTRTRQRHLTCRTSHDAVCTHPPSHCHALCTPPRRWSPLVRTGT